MSQDVLKQMLTVLPTKVEGTGLGLAWWNNRHLRGTTYYAWRASRETAAYSHLYLPAILNRQNRMVRSRGVGGQESLGCSYSFPNDNPKITGLLEKEPP